MFDSKLKRFQYDNKIYREKSEQNIVLLNQKIIDLNERLHQADDDKNRLSVEIRTLKKSNYLILKQIRDLTFFDRIKFVFTGYNKD